MPINLILTEVQYLSLPIALIRHLTGTFVVQSITITCFIFVLIVHSPIQGTLLSRVGQSRGTYFSILAALLEHRQVVLV